MGSDIFQDSTMFAQTKKLVPVGASQCQQQRGMANLKLIGMRLKSVKNIQRITQSMKMVSAAKSFYDHAEIEDTKKDEAKELYIAITSDRGLAGAVHSSIGKQIRNELNEKADLDKVKILCVGDKSRAFFQRWFKDNIIMVGSEIGRMPPQFGDASKVANAILTCGFEFDSGKMLYNKYNSVVSYTTTTIPIFSLDSVANANKITVYDSLDSDVLQSYMEYSLASLIYYAMKEGAC